MHITKILVDVEMPCKPLFKIKLTVEPFEITRKLGVVHIGNYSEPVYERVRDSMSEHIIHLIAYSFKGLTGVVVVLLARLLLRPPAYMGLSVSLIYRICTAEAEELMPAYLKHLATHKVEDVLPDLVRPAAAEIHHGVFIELVKVLVVAVDKGYGSA